MYNLDIYSSNYKSQNSVWIYVLDVDDCCAEFKDEEWILNIETLDPDCGGRMKILWEVTVMQLE